MVAVSKMTFLNHKSHASELKHDKMEHAQVYVQNLIITPYVLSLMPYSIRHQVSVILMVENR